MVVCAQHMPLSSFSDFDWEAASCQVFLWAVSVQGLGSLLIVNLSSLLVISCWRVELCMQVSNIRHSSRIYVYVGFPVSLNPSLFKFSWLVMFPTICVWREHWLVSIFQCKWCPSQGKHVSFCVESRLYSSPFLPYHDNFHALSRLLRMINIGQIFFLTCLSYFIVF